MRKVTETHFTADANPRFTAYLQAQGLTVGDEFQIADYIRWVNIRLIRFKAKHGIKGIEPITKIKDGHRKFTEYLKSEEARH